ncbi:hypothetical protein ACFLU5_15685 [Bacteroidota bacterium]
MLNFFRINDPYRLIFVLIILFIVRLPFLISGNQITYTEIEWLVIGEKMGDGFSMYGNIYHYLGPLSAGIYWLMDLVFGKSAFVYQIFGILIVFLQASIFNFFLLNHKAYNENNYIPALIYSVLMFTFFDFINLSPVLLGLTFVILAFDLTFRHIEGRNKRDWIVLNIGIYLGIATLFYLPMFLFMISTFFAFILFTNTIFRRYLLLLYGFFVPILMVMLYFYMKGNYQDFASCYFYPIFLKREYILMDWKSILTIGLIPTVFVLISVLKVFTTTVFINYQVRLQNFMMVLIGMGLLVWIIDFYKPPHLWIVLVPSGAFFITHFFLLIRNKWSAEVLFIILSGLLLYQNYASYFGILNMNNIIRTENHLIDKSNKSNMVTGRKILNLDYNRDVFLNNKMATPYLNLELSEIQLKQLNYYDNLSKVYSNFYKDFPDEIIDTNGWMPAIFSEIPLLEKEYYIKGDDYYVRKSQ